MKEKDKKKQDWNQLMLDFQEIQRQKGDFVNTYTDEEKKVYVSFISEKLKNQEMFVEVVEQDDWIRRSAKIAKFLISFYSILENQPYISYFQTVELYKHCCGTKISREHASRVLSKLAREGYIKKISMKTRLSKFAFVKVDDEKVIKSMLQDSESKLRREKLKQKK